MNRARTPSEAWTCAEFELRLGEYHNAQLDAPDLVRASAHLRTCAACTDTLARWTVWKDALSATPLLSDARLAQLSGKIMRKNARPAQRVPPRLAPRMAKPGLVTTRLATRWLPVLATALMLLAVVARLLVGALRPAAVPARVTSPSVALRAGQSGLFLDGRVTLRAAGTLRIDEEATRLSVELEDGALVADLDALPIGVELSVCTAETCARAMGTAFSVTKDRAGDVVAVSHGLVAVSPRALPVAEVVLAVGDRFVAPWHDRTGAAAVHEPGSSVGRPGALPSVRARPASSDDCRERSTPGAISADPTAAEPCLGQAGSEQWAALGDAYLKAKLPTRAYAAYAKVYRDFPRSPEAESALFALAGLDEERGQTAAAERRLEEYLGRYQSGDFVAEARWRMARLLVHQRSFRAAARQLEALVSSPGTRGAEATFLLASICDRELDDPARAVRMYRAYLVHPAASAALERQARERLRDLDAEE